MSKLYDGDTFTHDGLTFTLSLERDNYQEPPWEQCEGHGVVSNWTRRDKMPSEVILYENRGSKRYYDVAASMAIAKRDGWNSKPYNVEGETKGQRAYKAVMADIKYLRGWCNDDWTYCVVIVTCQDFPDMPYECIGGVESNAYEDINDLALELADEILSRVSNEVRKAVV